MGRLLHAEFGHVDVLDDTSHDLLNTSSRSYRIAKARSRLDEIDGATIAFAARAYPWVTRIALSVVFFWFGFIKLVGLSAATGLAKALTAKTVGLGHFGALFDALALLECVIGVLCLIPRAVRLLLPLVFFHLALVCAPLVLVPELTWEGTLVPTMDGQYIIKNVLIVAAAVGLAANASPRRRTGLNPDHDVHQDGQDQAAEDRRLSRNERPDVPFVHSSVIIDTRDHVGE